MRKNLRIVLGLTAAAGLALGGLTACSGGGDGGGKSITVGSKDFSENIVLAEMFSILLENGGYDVRESLNLGGTQVVFAAMESGKVDVYPEYTGTGLTTQLAEEPLFEADEVYQAVKTGFEERWDIRWLDPYEINNTWCLAITREAAETHGIQSISDLAANNGELDMALTQEFIAREDGLPGLSAKYGGLEFASEKAYAIGLGYQAIANGDADGGVCFRTDGQISAQDLVVLEDDQSYWPPYYVAPIVRGEVLDAHPDIAEILAPLGEVLDEETMRELNWQVDGDKQNPERVAQAFLEEQGLV
ncbi:glycine/betaine ABC transporter substrate-binding protein [Leucobacter weissii]|uniref:Glycine/betaine ABC transporter substrate-binding protein n=1 Tax=Leucobacter weissii TaxID=1983706 RepID=A0A939MGU0_9MICO|nr:glycine betaine ABC transporter substrate-binding protein [Leucobacter weissii]MBO1900346.1 glycine/betaine ABC transporter substrate-binding protein [Leucobacter weissii]